MMPGVSTLIFDFDTISVTEFINNMFKLMHFLNLMNLAPASKKEIKNGRNCYTTLIPLLESLSQAQVFSFCFSHILKNHLVGLGGLM